VSAATQRLGQLGERWGLDSAQIRQFGEVLDLLHADAHAPSTVRGRAAVDVHIADSLSALALEAVRRARSVADLGSGAGFPGVALAIALPEASVTLVESAVRKCEFLERLISGVGIANARVVRARAEDWPDGAGAHDLVTARALAPLAVVCEYAAPLLGLGGTLVAWKGDVPAAEAQSGDRASEILGLQAKGAVRSEPYAGSVAHHLHVFVKVAQTPTGYPRRPGIASKRPLGGRAEP
jgi:16S rRNA (guanine527-N7)-methyltransferase